LTKLIVMAMVMSLFLVGSVQAQKKADDGVNLFDLGAKGIATVKESPSGDGSKNYLIIEVSPSWWKKQSKATKESVVNQGMMLAKAQKKNVIHGVYVANKSNHKWLAYGDLSSGAIEIYKKEGSFLE
jgi:hypothetical protein